MKDNRKRFEVPYHCFPGTPTAEQEFARVQRLIRLERLPTDDVTNENRALRRDYIARQSWFNEPVRWRAST